MQNVLHQQLQSIDNISQETIINTYFLNNNNKDINVLIDELSSASVSQSESSLLFEPNSNTDSPITTSQPLFPSVHTFGDGDVTKKVQRNSLSNCTDLDVQRNQSEQCHQQHVDESQTRTGYNRHDTQNNVVKLCQTKPHNIQSYKTGLLAEPQMDYTSVQILALNDMNINTNSNTNTNTQSTGNSNRGSTGRISSNHAHTISQSVTSNSHHLQSQNNVQYGYEKANVNVNVKQEAETKTDINVTINDINSFGNDKNCLTVHAQDVHHSCSDFARPYKCNYCTKAFKQKSNLQQHIRIHTGERPFKCSICNKLFTRKSSLNRHIRIHTGDLPYQCMKCNKRFNERSNCNKHSKKCKGRTL